MSGRDHAGRCVPVRGQHRLGKHLAVRDRVDGKLTLLGSTPIANQSGVGAVDARLSPDGQTLYVNESRIAAIGEFDVDGGQLTERASVSLPVGATPAGVAVK